MSRFRENAVDLSLDEFIILLRIQFYYDSTQQKLADHLQKDKSIVLRQINGLLDKNYVTRTVDPNDKRKKNLVLTTEGTQILERSKEVSRQVSEELLKGISPENRKIFEQVVEMMRINAGLENDNCNSK